jgi:uncharacterized membrane protein
MDTGGLAGRVCHALMAGTIGVLLSVAWSDIAAQGATYSYTTILFPGGRGTIVNGVNRAGDLVGSYRDAANDVHGFLRRDGKFTSIDYPGAKATVPHGISASGDIVGQFSLPDTPAIAHGFVLTKQGKFTSVTVPGHANTVAVRLLSDGTIIGCYHDAGPDSMHAMKLVGGKQLSALERPNSMHNGATPDGKTFVGTYNDQTEGKSHGRSYVLNGSTFTLFDVPGSSTTSAQDINAAGVIVGTYLTNGVSHGFVRERDVYTTLNAPGATSTNANGISDDGTIVGSFVDAGGVTRGFIATRK